MRCKGSEKRPASGNTSDTVAPKKFANNMYSVLTDGDAGNSPVAVKKRKPKQQCVATEPERKCKCPPIFVKGDPPNLRASIRDCIRNGYFRGSFRLCSEGVKLMLESKESFDNAKDFLTKRKWEFFTHDMPGTKPLKVLLRGLDDMAVDELVEELEFHDLKPVKVDKIARHDRTRKYRDQLYLVHLEHGSTTLKDLRAIKIINSTVVEWQKYKPVHREVTQCMNCLRFGHGTRNCSMASRCSTCGGNHQNEACDQMEESQPKCANCGEKHRATDKNCPKRAEFLVIRQRASTKNQPRKTVAPPPLTSAHFPQIPKPQRSIPVLPPLQPQQRLVAAAASVPSKAQCSQAPPINQWHQPPPGFRRQDNAPLPPEDAAPLYSSEQLAPIFSDLVARLRSCKSRFDQIYTLGLFVIENGY